MWAKIQTNNVNTCVINTYCPQSGNSKEDKEKHYHELTETYQECRKSNVTIIMGDMNTRIQGRCEGEEQILGNHVFGKGTDVIEHQTQKQRKIVNCSSTFAWKTNCRLLIPTSKSRKKHTAPSKKCPRKDFASHGRQKDSRCSTCA